MTLGNVDLNKKSVYELTSLASQIGESTSNSNLSIDIFKGVTEAEFEQAIENGINSTDTEEAKFYQNIQSVGYSNFFDSVDKDQDSTLSLEELTSIAGADGDELNLSGEELNAQIKSYLGGIMTEMINTNNFFQTADTTSQKIGLYSLKQQIQADYNNSIYAARNTVSELIQSSSSINQLYSSQYSNLTENLNTIDEQISEKENQIAENEKQITALKKEIKDLEKQKNSLSDDDAKLAEINQLLENKTGLLNSLKKANTTLKSGDKGISALMSKKNDVQEQMDEILTTIADQDSNLKQAIIDAEVQASSLEDEKNQRLSQIDSQIQAATVTTNPQSSVQGAKPRPLIKGESNDLGSRIVEIAMGCYNQGYNEDDGSYTKFTNGREEHWCADFVTYVAKQACTELGIEVPEGFGSPSVRIMRDWAIENNCYSNVQDMDLDTKMEFIQENIQPGSMIVWKQNGEGHIGFVSEVYEDGTLSVVDGNWGDQISSRDLNKTGGHSIDSISGFITLS